jgi:hypothetical protein
MTVLRARWVGLAAAVVLATQLTPLAPPAFGSAPELTLTSARETVRWSGHFGSAGVVASVPEACAAIGCDEISLSLELPRAPRNRDGGLQVGLRWSDEEQDLDLYVYGPDGALAAKSDGFYVSTSESVLIEAPENGLYRIVVVPRETQDLAYDGVAQIEQGIAPRPVRDLLPDLIALPSRHATFSTGSYLLSEPSAMPSSCYPEEIVEAGARRCLRFDQVLGNSGTGPFEIRYDLGGLTTDRQLRQRVYRSDGSSWEREAGSYELHPTHAHFHYRNFAVSMLWASDETGQRLGDQPVRVGQKNGFCVMDIENIWFGRHGDAARTYYFPECQAPGDDAPSGPVLRQGMSVGWADVYNWFLPDQYIEVSGVADGYYLLDTIADADHLVLESNEHNNTVSTLIRICGTRAEVVGEQQSCA